MHCHDRSRLTIRRIKVAGTVAEIETDDGDMVVCL